LVQPSLKDVEEVLFRMWSGT